LAAQAEERIKGISPVEVVKVDDGENEEVRRKAWKAVVSSFVVIC